MPDNPHLTNQQSRHIGGKRTEHPGPRSRCYPALHQSVRVQNTSSRLVCAAGTLIRQFDLSWRLERSPGTSSTPIIPLNESSPVRSLGVGPPARCCASCQIDDSITPIHGNAFGVRSREFGKVCLIDHQYSTSGVVGRRRVKLRQREVYPASTKVASKSYRDETTRL